MASVTLSIERIELFFFRFIIKHIFLNYEQVKDSMTLRLKCLIVANTYSAGFTKDHQRPLE